MLARFTIENFMSFKEKQEFTMFPGSETSNKELYSKISNIKLLNYSSIYGGNAAGKSNLIKAIDAGKKLIINGIENSNSQTQYFKIEKKMKEKKSYFDYEILINEKLYAYGFEIILSEGKILSEWLVQLTPNGDKPIFTRDIENEEYDNRLKTKDKESKKKLEGWLEDSIYTEKELFLKTVISKNRDDLHDLKIFNEVYNWFNDKLVIVYPDTKLFNIDSITENRHSIADMIRELDTGIKRICKRKVSQEYLPKPLSDEKFQNLLKTGLKREIEKIPKNYKHGMSMTDGVNLFNITYNSKTDKLFFEKMIFWHADEDKSEPLELHEESDGTRRIIDILMYMVNARIKGQTLLIDEIERSMHPNIVREIIKFYLHTNKQLTTQLLFTSHDENFIELSLARKDTIWFVNKNVDGHSQLTSLREFKIRSDKKNLKYDYLEGRFGGTPAIGSLSRLFDYEVENA